jgi:hypothetical protein
MFLGDSRLAKTDNANGADEKPQRVACGAPYPDWCSFQQHGPSLKPESFIAH